MKVGIVGGGIAGLTVALALKKEGIPFHLFEKTKEFTEVGAGIMLYDSILGILDRIGVGDAIRDHSVKIQSFIIKDIDSKPIVTLKDGFKAYSIVRPTLIQLLCTHLHPSEYSLGSLIQDIHVFDDRVDVNVNSTNHSFDLLIAADGIWSGIRNTFIPNITPRNTQHVMWRGFTNAQNIHATSNSLQEVWGQNKRFGYSYVTDELIFWYAIEWRKRVPKQLHSIKEHIQASFNEYPTIVQTLFANAHPTIIETDLFDIPQPQKKWFYKRVVLMGDSIHASTPHLALGGCQAIESAYSLASLLAKHPLDEALILYQKNRSKRVTFTGNLSHWFGRISHQKSTMEEKIYHSVFRILPSFYLKHMLNKMLKNDL